MCEDIQPKSLYWFYKIFCLLRLVRHANLYTSISSVYSSRLQFHYCIFLYYEILIEVSIQTVFCGARIVANQPFYYVITFLPSVLLPPIGKPTVLLKTLSQNWSRCWSVLYSYLHLHDHINRVSPRPAVTPTRSAPSTPCSKSRSPGAAQYCSRLARESFTSPDVEK